MNTDYCGENKMKCETCENRYSENLCRAANIRFQTGMTVENAWSWCRGKYFKPKEA